MAEIIETQQLTQESEREPRAKHRDFIQKILIIILFALILAVFVGRRGSNFARFRR